MKLTSTSPPARRCATSKDRPCISKTSRHEEKQRAQQTEHQGGAEKGRNAEHAHLGDGGLEQRQRETAERQLGRIGDPAERIGRSIRCEWAPCPRAGTGRR